MKHISTHYFPVFFLHFTTEEIAVLTACACRHYDAVCKDTLSATGILTRINLHHQNFPEEPHKLDWRQLDTLAKVVEIGAYFSDSEQCKIAFGLGLEFKKLLTTDPTEGNTKL